MKTILVIGAGSRCLAAALRMLDEGAHIHEFLTSAQNIRTHDFYSAPEPAADDPFCGGCRSKGEKKRAARQRRLMGGY